MGFTVIPSEGDFSLDNEHLKGILQVFPCLGTFLGRAENGLCHYLSDLTSWLSKMMELIEMETGEPFSEAEYREILEQIFLENFSDNVDLFYLLAGLRPGEIIPGSEMGFSRFCQLAGDLYHRVAEIWYRFELMDPNLLPEGDFTITNSSQEDESRDER